MVVKMSPAFKDYVWGGTRLKTEWGKVTSLPIVAESWELSTHKDGESAAEGGQYNGQSLSALLSPKFLGPACDRFDRFPMLIKFIDAKKNLSVQVHPDDDYALKHEDDFGKAKVWYIADAEEGSGIYCGMKEPVTKERFLESIKNNTLEELLAFIPVRKGDFFYIPPRTVHAILRGVTVCEIQQNSNVTYRIYDYGRLGADGNPRTLHLDKAVEVADLGVRKPQRAEILCDEYGKKARKLISHNNFSVEEYIAFKKIAINPKDSFAAVVILSGIGRLGQYNYGKGDTFFISAGSKTEILPKEGTTYLYCYVENKD